RRRAMEHRDDEPGASRARRLAARDVETRRCDHALDPSDARRHQRRPVPFGDRTERPAGRVAIRPAGAGSMSSRRAAAAAAALLVCGCEARVDQLPDWSGQWENVGATPSPDGGFYESLEQVLEELEWSPPLKPDSQAAIDRVVEIQRKAMAAMRDGIDPGGAVTACTFGFPTIMLESPLMFEILPTPKETALIFSSREIRHVYTDGRDHPPEGDVWPTPWGDSIGHWEGDTLVIDTIAEVCVS